MTKQEPKKVRNYNTKVTGVMQLFVIASVAYMGYVVILGTDGIAPKVMTIPALIWATVLAIQKFTK